MSVGVVIIVAMESERRHLDTLMPGWETIESPIWPTQRHGDVMCITSGIGMVAAAAATEYAIGKWSPTMVMNYGCTGAHHRDLSPGDVVIGDRLFHQGRMRIAPNGNLIPLEIGFQVPGEVEPATRIGCDPTLMAIAEEVALRADLPVWPLGKGLSERAPIFKTGTVSSGDIWLQSPQLIDAAHERTGSLCEDMEAASIAQICALHKLPFLTVKDISNSELQAATQFDGSSSALPEGELGLRAAMIIAGVITELHRTARATRLPQS